MFESLSQRINQAIQKIKGQEQITATNISSTLKEIRRALVEADVPYKIAKSFVQEVKTKALGEKVNVSLSPGQLFTKIVEDQLTLLMGEKPTPIPTQGNPMIIMLIGLQGAGKTTLTGKLAHYFKAKNKKPFLISCDVYRPAAAEQLETLAAQVEVPIYTDKAEKDPVALVQKGLDKAKADNHKLIIIDTAGRQAIDQAMMEELQTLKQKFPPQQTLFVVDAMIGQIGLETIQQFHTQVQFDGVVLTKMDGDARGGIALAVRKVTGQPIKLISTGEKLADLEDFHPDRIAKRILGMGDVTSLVERIEKAVDEKEARELNKKLQQQKLDFNDLRKQLQTLKKMGSLKSLMGLMPGLDQQKVDESQFDQWEVLISSMTPQERSHPHLLKEPSRKGRITQGSGTPPHQVNKMLKHFDAMQKQMQKLQQQSKKKGGLPNPF